jgi:hypothetical protein
MIDGATTVTDAADTENNKTLVRNFVTDILVNGDMAKLAGYFNGDQYIQHNPMTAPINSPALGNARWRRWPSKASR